ncbi:MAG TPA: endonuclease III domain-containing protein [Nitrospiria bacterium]|nr:endonuclease III domain-containing protein [Nitrospiria bacterium]
MAPFRDPWAESKGRQALLSKIFDSLYATFGPQHWWPSESVFEVVVGAILTQNTAWTNVEKAIENLRSAGCLTPESLRGVSTEKLALLLRPSGYFNLKAERLKSFINFLYQQYSGDLRRMLGEEPHLLRQKLLRVKGIGPETADSILLYAGGFPWFVVDAYTRRILSRHGLVADEVSYQGLQDFFMNTLPRDTKLYNEYHALMVRLGKDVCRREPLCEQCPLLEVLGEPIHK